MEQPTFMNLINREPWQADGTCRQVDIGDIFYPEKGGSARDAKLVCQHCPVLDECLEYSIRTEQVHGVWGGRSERERWRIRRGEDVPFRIPGVRERNILECQMCGGPFTGRGKYCGGDCRNVAASRARRRRDVA